MSLYGKLYFKLKGGVAFARRSGVKVGDECRILTDRLGSEPWLIEIGNKVTISSMVTFINHDGIGWLLRDKKGRRYKYSRIRIGDNVFVGANSVLLPGIEIGSNCVIGAGSIVSKSIPSGVVAAGNPARYICDYQDLMERVSRWSTDEDGKHTDDYRQFVDSLASGDFQPPIAAIKSKPSAC